MLPNMGRKVPEANEESIREIVFYNYRILYKIEKNNLILILGVVHVARDISNINPLPWEVT